MSGLELSTTARQNTVWAGLGGLAALGFLALTRTAQGMKPAVKAAMKEGYAFKEWLLTRAEHLRADLPDAAAEARHDHDRERDREQLLNVLSRDKELLAKVEALIRSKAESQPAATEKLKPSRTTRKSRPRQRKQRSE